MVRMRQEMAGYLRIVFTATKIDELVDSVKTGK